MADTIKGMFGVKTKAQKRAEAAAKEANDATIRATNTAAEERQSQAADIGYAARRASKLGRRQLSWMPLGGNRPSLGAGV
jgi:hypothetical protein